MSALPKKKAAEKETPRPSFMLVSEARPLGRACNVRIAQVALAYARASDTKVARASRP